MAKKIFLNRERAIPTAHAPSVSREEPDLEVASSSRNCVGSETKEQLPFIILVETSKPFPKFNTTGCSMLIKFKSPGEEQEPTVYVKECVTAVTSYLVDEVADRDLVGLRIRSTENVQDKVIGIENAGYTVVSICWCEFRKLLLENPGL